MTPDPRQPRLFKVQQPTQRAFALGDFVVLVGLGVALYAGVRLAFYVPATIRGPRISLSPRALPFYAALSLGRMSLAYLLSLLFALVYGRLAAFNRRAEQVLMPLLDVFQSVPILSFLPVILLSLSAVLHEDVATELASIVLIFTSQVWNLTFAWYQSLTTTPKELREASTVFRFNGWLRFKTLELPFAAINLIWNSMMSWAGGWFFLMAAEIFTVGRHDFRLPGLGAYLQEAANQGDLVALAWGIGVLILLIVALDQFLWRPLLAWAERFKLEMVANEHPPASWFYNTLRQSHFLSWLAEKAWKPIMAKIDGFYVVRDQSNVSLPGEPAKPSRGAYLLGFLLGLGLLYGAIQASSMLISVPGTQWREIVVGLLATLVRVIIALTIALAWTLPVGILIGTSPRLSGLLQPVVQIAASVPATALFPAFLLVALNLPGGLNLAALALMVIGTQWYLLFNVIAGSAAIPQDLKYTSVLLGLGRWERWRTLFLPALFPYLITGAITASGGAWNASVVAEYVHFGGKVLSVTGIGALIAQATALGDYPLLLAATLSMILAVVIINRLVWRRLYRLAEEQYRME